MGILGKEAVAGMDRIHIRDLSGRDQAVNSKITVAANAFTDTDGLVSHLNVHGIGIGFRINRHRADPHLATGAHDAEGDFTPIGDQNLLKHGWMTRIRDKKAEKSERLNLEERLPEFDGLGVVDQDLGDDTAGLRLDLVHHLHGLDNADDRVGTDLGAHLDVRGGFRGG